MKSFNPNWPQNYNLQQQQLTFFHYFLLAAAKRVNSSNINETKLINEPSSNCLSAFKLLNNVDNEQDSTHEKNFGENNSNTTQLSSIFDLNDGSNASKSNSNKIKSDPNLTTNSILNNKISTTINTKITKKLNNNEKRPPKILKKTTQLKESKRKTVLKNFKKSKRKTLKNSILSNPG